MPQLLRKLGATVWRAARFAVQRPGSALVALRMAFWVAALTALVRFLPMSRALSLLTPRRRPAHRADSDELQRRLAHLLDLLLAADFWVFTPVCWKRAPVLYRFLALSGIRTRVVFGVRRRESGALDGHAWLEADGEPLLERTAPDYTVTFSYPA